LNVNKNIQFQESETGLKIIKEKEIT